MNIAEAKEQISETVDAYLSRDETGAQLIPSSMQRPIFLVGAPGIGKTAIVEQVAHELGIGLVSYSMTHHTRQSALGLPFIVHREYEGESFDVSEYTMSEIIASIYEYMEKTGLKQGILFLDEINCVSETLYPSMLQFLQFKTFGRHRVPDGWVIVTAGNPPEYNKSVHEFDVVTLDRLRKVDVEPDLKAWMQFALASGVHPAIITYLSVKNQHFYRVESSPSGKVFVTARGWTDLSRVMRVYEKQGKKVNRALISQFLQSDEIAGRFSQYYALFTKYQSDYQVESILEGDPAEGIKTRAKTARLDERLAVVRLLLNALETDADRAVEETDVLATCRDIIREAKAEIAEGNSPTEVIEASAKALLDDAASLVKAGTATDADMRPQRLAAAKLSGYLGICALHHATEGQEGYAQLAASYRADVQREREDIERTQTRLSNAFSFTETVFGDDKEMAAFVAELSGRTGTAQFISRFGSDAYYEHNARVVPGSSRDAMLERIANLDLEDIEHEALAAESQEQARIEGKSCGGCSTCTC